MPTADRRHSQAFLIAAAFLALLCVMGGIAFDGPVAVVLIGAFVLLLGLPHGALDFWLARRAGLWGDGGGFYSFHLLYLSIAASVVAAFLIAPALALAAFLAASVWHFADDWRGLPTATRIGCASATVIVPTLAHTAEVSTIFDAITGLTGTLPASIPPALQLGMVGLLGVAIADAARRDHVAGAEAATIAVLALVLPPLAFFAAYFILFHSPRHMLRHRDAITGVGRKPILIAYTAASLVLILFIGVGLALNFGGSVTTQTLRAVFIGLAALSVPHALLIEYDRTRTAPSRSSATALSSV